MPKMQSMSAELLQRISSTRNSAKIKKTPEEIFESIAKKNSLRKFHFKGIISGDTIHLFNGVGKEIEQFENSHKGEISCRVFALDFYFTFPFEQRNVGGYKIDFIRE